MERIWITGFRNYELGIFGDKDPKLQVIQYALKKILKNLVENDDVEWLITGGQLGVEQWSLQAALDLNKTTNLNLKTALMTPVSDFASQWNQSNQDRLTNLKEQVTFTASVQNDIYKSPKQFKQYQKFMVQHTDRAIMLYDEEVLDSPVKYDYDFINSYREDHNYSFKIIDFLDLQDFAEMYQNL